MVFRYYFQDYWDIPISGYCGSLMPLEDARGQPLNFKDRSCSSRGEP